jgi:hypothetical protein
MILRNVNELLHQSVAAPDPAPREIGGDSAATLWRLSGDSATAQRLRQPEK